YTYVTVQPLESFKGLAPASGPIVVKQLGGILADRGVYVPGQAQFTQGENVLLFLGVRARDRSLFTLGLWQGKWTIESDAASGQQIAVQREPTSRAVRARASLASMRADLVRLAGPAPVGQADANLSPPERPSGASPFVLFNPPVRWTKTSVPVNVETGSQPGLAGGGLAQVVAAAAQWNIGSSLTLTNGPRVPPRCQAVVGTDILVTFNDPCGEISSDPGVLAVAAVGFAQSGGQTINGRVYLPITDVVITTSSNPAAQPFMMSPTCFQSTVSHEVGHGVGIGHTPDASALMFFAETGACFQGAIPVGPDDRSALFTIYPPGGGPPAGIPGRATVTSATAAGGMLNITWTLGPGAAATAHRLDFFAGTSPVLSLNFGPATSVALPIPAGTVGTFSVQVTALAGATPGESSASFPFTLGGGGGPPPPPPPPGCTGPPASPTVSGSITAGMALVSWPAVPGATSYIVSAGTNMGGSNLFPATNVGSNTSVGASGLPAGFSAWVRVIAVNACGQSAPTDFFLSSGPAPPPPPPPPSGSVVQFTTSANACSCWVTPITLQIDGTTVGSMSCSGSAGPFPTTAGAHMLQACDSLGCVPTNANVPANGTFTLTLTCQ
ncbi:MAG: hypothetical protein ACT4QD_15815, partial [Acidobacteriota bacterium]